jgi:hypothetical protein
LRREEIARERRDSFGHVAVPRALLPLAFEAAADEAEFHDGDRPPATDTRALGFLAYGAERVRRYERGERQSERPR